MSCVISPSRSSSTSINSTIRAFMTHPQAPHRLDFAAGWDSAECATRTWYTLQPCTTYRFLQYRKDRKRPFTHEFVVAELDNGTFCRFDRRRDNDDPENGRAEDTVYVFSRSDLEFIEMERSSDVLLRLNFPEGQDLKDVLETCWAMQMDARAKDYTLTRYNCYFFSWTILAVAARRTVDWTAALTTTRADDWRELVQSVAQKDSNAQRRQFKPVRAMSLDTLRSDFMTFLLEVMTRAIITTLPQLELVLRESVFQTTLTLAVQKQVEAACKAAVQDATRAYAFNAARDAAMEALYETTWQDIMRSSDQGSSWVQRVRELVRPLAVLELLRPESGEDACEAAWESFATVDALVAERARTAWKAALVRASEVSEKCFGRVCEGVVEFVVARLPNSSPDALKIEMKLHDLATSLSFYSTEQTHADLQKYIQKRILNHCKNASKAEFVSTELSRVDIEEAMTRVWKAVVGLGSS